MPRADETIPAAWSDVLAERRRQVEAEGWTPAVVHLRPEPADRGGAVVMNLSPFGSSPGGIRIIEDPSLTETVADWSKVRSPSRAVRRLRQGHRQNIRWIEVPKPIAYAIGDAFVMHPEYAAKLRAHLSEAPRDR